jgi:hypothetical protein
MRLLNTIPILSFFGYSFGLNALDKCKSLQSIPLFNHTRDIVALHYDFCPDADDLISAVADRSILETVFGFDFISKRVVKTGGTYSKDRGYYKSSIQILNTIWNDIGNVFNVNGASSSPDSDAVKYETKVYLDTILNGGYVFLKEGGQADYTAIVVREMEKTIPGSGKCVVVAQHSTTNESHYGKGVLGFMKTHTTYVKIPDGNKFLRKDNWKFKGLSFSQHTLKSRLECAWIDVFSEFKKQKSYCKTYSGKRVDVSKCVDFSDTFELLWLLGIDDQKRRTDIQQFVKKYIQPTDESEKLKCNNTAKYITKSIFANETLTSQRPTVLFVNETSSTTNKIVKIISTEEVSSESNKKDHAHCLIIPAVIVVSFMLSAIVF